MPEVAIKIGPRTYNIRCGEGEQERIAALGSMIAEKYAQLGNARAPTESQNLLFAALFMADELSEARNDADKAYRKAKAARDELEASMSMVEHEKSRSGGKKAELRAEIETLRKSEARARDEIKSLKADLTAMREANEHQHDLFGAPIDEGAVADALERIAAKAEAAADAMERA
ncbi:MAG: cell division protein ZapA [Erythrobacter sp.]|nr:cell division protein ZapA [Erythrobacter sp.]